jgi:hypothetical protein
MESETIDVVTGWDSVPVGDGYRGLRDLADDEFTGAVTDGVAWAFVLNGRIVGVFEGSIEQFEDADLTAYTAPDPALPLLFAMQELGGETRAKYYTNDTPLSEAHETLSSGSFTGFVELSENVLSGDYYVVYYGGKSMSAAFVGSSRRLFTGDEAFERANDEVGIYRVRQVDIDIVEIPEGEAAAESPETSDVEPSATGADDDASAEDAATDDAETPSREAVTFGQQDDASAGDAADEAEPEATRDASEGAEPEATPDVEESPEGDAEADSRATDAEADSRATDAEADSRATDAEAQSANDAESDAETADRARDASNVGGARSGASDADEAAPGSAAGDRSGTDGTAGPSADRPGDPREWVDDFPDEEQGESADGEDVFSEEAKWREAKSIPALDPDDTADEVETSSSGSQTGAVRKRQSNADSRSASETESTGSAGRQSERSGGRKTGGSRPASARGSGSTTSRAPAGKLRRQLESVVEERDELKSRLQKAISERERLEAERDELQDERDEARERAASLENRITELEAEVERLESALDSASGTGGQAGSRTMSPTDALEGTNLFVRYDRKSQGTLEAAHAGRADREDVNQNLRIDYHTTFDTTDLTVEGEPFEEFLRNTIEYGFVEWLVRDLVYEIRETNNEHSLEALYDAIPRIDRVELRGVVSGDAHGDEEAESRQFDVVLWDGMGNPLVVANLNDSRHAATQSTVSSLVENARWVAEHDDTLGAACFVTSSFFEPEALDVAAEATGSGLLSRSKRKAFVKLSRKSGFHVCLVEGRNEEFYVNFPDL